MADEPYIAIPKWLVGRRDLGPVAKLAWGAIRERVGRNGEAWPGYRKIASDIGCRDPKTVLRAIADLERAGLVEVVRRDSGQSNQYRFPTGGKNGPVAKTDRWQNATPGGGKNGPEALAKCLHNNLTQLNNPTLFADEPSTQTPGRKRPHRWPTDGPARIYAAYPRKVGRQAAIKAIEQALVRIAARKEAPADPVAWLLTRVNVFAQSPAGKAGRYTPHPTTWFRQGRYDDDQTEWTRDGDSGSTQRSPARIEAPPDKYANVAIRIGRPRESAAPQRAEKPAENPTALDPGSV